MCMATAKQLRSGSWRVKIKDNDDPSYPWKSFTAATPDEAEFLAAQYKFLKKKNARPKMRSLGVCMDDYIDNRSNILSPSTIALYRLIRRTAFPNLVKFPVGKITPKMIQAAVNEYSANHSYKTVSNAVGFLKVVFGEVMPDFKLEKGDKAFVMINGSGATTLMEMWILYKDCVKYLEELGIEVVANMVGEILTVQEQAGFQLNISKWDDEVLRLWNTPAHTIAFYKE